MNITLLNTSIATATGETYIYEPLTLNQAQWLTNHQNAIVRSAIGHDATAKIMSNLLGREVPTNRIEYRQSIGDIAVVFKLNGRPPEGKILSLEEMEAIGYQFGVMIAFNPLALDWKTPEEMQEKVQDGWPLLLDTELSQRPKVGFVADDRQCVEIAGNAKYAFTASGIIRMAMI